MNNVIGKNRQQQTGLNNSSDGSSFVCWDLSV